MWFSLLGLESLDQLNSVCPFEVFLKVLGKRVVKTQNVVVIWITNRACMSSWEAIPPEVPPVPQSVSHSNKIYIMCSIVMGLDSRAFGVCCNAVNGCQEHSTIQSTQGTEWFTWTSSGFFVSLVYHVFTYLLFTYDLIHLFLSFVLCCRWSLVCSVFK